MLELSGVEKSYEGSPLLRGVSFSVGEGETVCLLGPSGGGKSTLLRIIAGLEEPEGGRITWNGTDLAAIPAHRRQFGLMFQDYALFPHRSVQQNAAFGLRMQGLPDGEITDRVAEVLSMVNMERFASRRVTELSGGEQQRVALARALAPRPRLLMLDEPLGALDRRLREDLAAEIRMVLQKTRVPAIYVTHDQEEAFAVADRLLILHDGMIIQDGTPEEVYYHPRTAWVADFFGLGNLLSGRVTSASPLKVLSPVGEFNAGNSSQAFQIGQQVNLLLRPDGAYEGDGENEITGKVVDSLFQGKDYRVDISLPGSTDQQGEIILRFILPRRAKPGEILHLSLPVENVQCLG